MEHGRSGNAGGRGGAAAPTRQPRAPEGEAWQRRGVPPAAVSELTGELTGELARLQAALRCARARADSAEDRLRERLEGQRRDLDKAGWHSASELRQSWARPAEAEGAVAVKVASAAADPVLFTPSPQKRMRGASPGRWSPRGPRIEEVPADEEEVVRACSRRRCDAAHASNAAGSPELGGAPRGARAAGTGRQPRRPLDGDGDLQLAQGALGDHLLSRAGDRADASPACSRSPRADQRQRKSAAAGTSSMSTTELASELVRRLEDKARGLSTPLHPDQTNNIQELLAQAGALVLVPLSDRPYDRPREPQALVFEDALGAPAPAETPRPPGSAGLGSPLLPLPAPPGRSTSRVFGDSAVVRGGQAAGAAAAVTVQLAEARREAEALRERLAVMQGGGTGKVVLAKSENAETKSLRASSEEQRDNIVFAADGSVPAGTRHQLEGGHASPVRRTSRQRRDQCRASTIAGLQEAVQKKSIEEEESRLELVRKRHQLSQVLPTMRCKSSKCAGDAVECADESQECQARTFARKGKNSYVPATVEYETLLRSLARQQERLQQLRNRSSEADSRHASIAAQASVQQRRSQELDKHEQSMLNQAGSRIYTGSRRSEAAGMESTRREVIEKMLEERAESLSRVKEETAGPTRDIDEMQPKVAATTHEVREQLAEQASNAEEDTKRWKAKEHELKRELAIAKDHEKSKQQHIDNPGAKELRSDVTCAAGREQTGVSAHISAATQLGQPLPPLSRSTGRPVSTSGGVGGQNGFSARGNYGKTSDADRSCQQQ
ncbi:unnamed protein product [Prorocentrum cordatum]|uniref:Centrosomal protein of 162 kDa n=1 Tax=Prorocentrum cordatum TaxID=2364126 RepID=A0ABN9V1Y8_9DINO|nr:unnamed protein product [Polarella glacialis]